ncbi:MAG TPA: segregation/condensation protein A [Balneolales bacterium]|nr:segregation/condensation protein A [Balneolales bacterium]HYX07162.1 segregation/condensation protein A [Bacteroidales bacterium]
MYRVQLQNFEGPLDLLLFFIKRDELDIYDIPISYITEQFFEYIHFLDELDLSIASEFILMASTLMAIKAKMMLPVTGDGEEDEFEMDPRYELVQALLEYKRFKEMAEEMSVMDHKTRQRYYRGFLEPDILEPEVDNGEVLKNVTLFDLMAAFKKVMSQVVKDDVFHKVERIPTNIEEQSKYIIGQLKFQGRLSFLDLCASLKHKIKMVVTFLASLELIKEQKVILYVGDDPTDFYLELNPQNPEENREEADSDNNVEKKDS